MLSIAGIFSFLTGLAGPLSTVIGKIADTKVALAKAENADEKAKLAAELDELHARQAVLTGQVGERLIGIVRVMLALPTVILLWKLEVYDKSLGEWTHGHTDQISPEMWRIVFAIIAFYFLYDITARFRR
jgi:hypothetical protein